MGDKHAYMATGKNTESKEVVNQKDINPDYSGIPPA